MKFVVLIALIAGCAPIDARTLPTPTPQIVYVTPEPAPSLTPAPTFNPKRISVGVAYIPVGSDPAPAKIANDLMPNLGPAWSVVTLGRGVASVREAIGTEDVIVVVDSSKNPRQQGWGLSIPAGIIVIHEIDGATMDIYIKSVIHEMGHVLGCCHGAGSDGIHVAGCSLSATLFPLNSALMCPSGGDAPTFNDYELAQMGL